jgi:tetratricopeptide (TPR) repeat protein
MTEISDSIEDSAAGGRGRGAHSRGRARKSRKKWYERTSVTLCVAAALVVTGVGFIHVITGVTSPYELPFDVVLKGRFGYRETWVRAERIQILPYVAAARRYPRGVQALQRAGYLPSGPEFGARIMAEQRENMQRWQAEFDAALGRSECPWQDRLQAQGPTPPPDPQDARACNLRGVTLARQGEYQAALAEFTRAIRRDPTCVDAFCNRALVYAALGNLGPAADDLARVVEIRPTHIDAYIRQARLHAAINEHKEAIADLTKALEIDPECAEAYFQRSLVHYARGDYEAALADVHRIQSLHLPVPAGLLEALQATGRPGRAEALRSAWR